MARKQDKMPARNKKNFRPTKAGAGMTKACGTAACATAYAAKLNNLCNDKIDIQFENGKLSISIDEKNSIHMRGPVSDIKEIEIKL